MGIKQEAIVVGGGMVGLSIALGLVREGIKVTVLDGADEAQRASRSNFGLAWSQNKGDTLPQYSLWTREALHLWPEFAGVLYDETGISSHYRGEGGLHVCLDEKELEDRRALFDRMNAIQGPYPLDLRILDRAEAAELLPGLGPEVAGAGYCAQDGDVSPHGVLMAMQRTFKTKGGKLLSHRHVTGIFHRSGNWDVECGDERHSADILVLAAGTGNKTLGSLVGLEIPVFGLKGQILVSERVDLRMKLPTHKVRQTESGTILIGDSKEPDEGLDDRSSAEIMGEIAARGIRMFPWLRDINLVRAWGGIRTMTADGYPIYDDYPQHPGLFSVNCHSGVTLAPVHALRLAPMIARGDLGHQVRAMSSERFDV